MRFTLITYTYIDCYFDFHTWRPLERFFLSNIFFLVRFRVLFAIVFSNYLLYSIHIMCEICKLHMLLLTYYNLNITCIVGAVVLVIVRIISQTNPADGQGDTYMKLRKHSVSYD